MFNLLIMFNTLNVFEHLEAIFGLHYHGLNGLRTLPSRCKWWFVYLITDKTIQSYAALGVGFVCLVIGLPLWWKTTDVYRVQLPYDEVAELASSPVFAFCCLPYR